MKKLKDLSESDRPREKLQAKGPEALSDLELLAILLGSGTKGQRCVDGGRPDPEGDRRPETRR